jgi:hypothetical protein
MASTTAANAKSFPNGSEGVGHTSLLCAGAKRRSTAAVPQVIDLIDRDDFPEWHLETPAGFPDGDGISRHFYGLAPLSLDPARR